MLRWIIAGLAALGCGGCAASAERAMPLAADEWDLLPLDQVCRQLNAGEPDSGLTAANLAFVRKAEMLAAYVRLWQALPDEERGRLREEQSRWYERALREADDEGQQFKGETAQNFVTSTAFAHSARRRTIELRRRLADLARS